MDNNMTTTTENSTPAIIRYDTGWTPNGGWGSETPEQKAAMDRRDRRNSIISNLAFGLIMSLLLGFVLVSAYREHSGAFGCILGAILGSVGLLALCAGCSSPSDY